LILKFDGQTVNQAQHRNLICPQTWREKLSWCCWRSEQLLSSVPRDTRSCHFRPCCLRHKTAKYPESLFSRSRSQTKVISVTQVSSSLSCYVNVTITNTTTDIRWYRCLLHNFQYCTRHHAILFIIGLLCVETVVIWHLTNACFLQMIHYHQQHTEQRLQVTKWCCLILFATMTSISML